MLERLIEQERNGLSALLAISRPLIRDTEALTPVAA